MRARPTHDASSDIFPVINLRVVLSNYHNRIASWIYLLLLPHAEGSVTFGLRGNVERPLLADSVEKVGHGFRGRKVSA